MIIGESFSRWIESWRDLPLLINQWANVVRWEMRPRIFLRTAEFLWQEGHTAHASKEEAVEETLKMLEVYRTLAEDILAVPVILGEKSEGERFPGADATYTLEAMMQDRKALQGGTSHYLGQNFAKGNNIRFTNKAGEVQYAYTTSWGVTTRLIGALIMTHGDDDGLRLPPKIAPKQVVIIPVIPKPELEEVVMAFVEKTAKALSQESWNGEKIRVHVDKRDIRGGEKTWDWIKKGVPLRLEIGPRDAESESVMLMRRDRPHKDKSKVLLNDLAAQVKDELSAVQKELFEKAKAHRDSHIYTHIDTFEKLKAFFTPKNEARPEIHGGFVLAKWCGDPKTEEMLKELKVTIRCLPLKQSGTQGTCVLTGLPATLDAIFAKSY
jgi:prolyl-tRNA synthetase